MNTPPVPGLPLTAPPLAHSIIDLIGQTPMLELHRIVAKRKLQGRLLAKLEYFNPGLSKKDRIAREMILEARKAAESGGRERSPHPTLSQVAAGKTGGGRGGSSGGGGLREGQTVVELTSGNTGTGLAIVCRALGHPFVAVMSRGNTIERARMMRALGAEVVLVDQAPGSPPNQVSGEDLALVEARARQIVAERGAYRANQFELEANVLAHERHTGPEIWQQSAGQVDVFVDFAGTAGTFTGVMRYLWRVSNPGEGDCGTGLRPGVLTPTAQKGGATGAGKDALTPPSPKLPPARPAAGEGAGVQATGSRPGLVRPINQLTDQPINPAAGNPEAGEDALTPALSRGERGPRAAVRGYLVEPASVAVLAGRVVTNPSHKIQGGGYAMADLPLLDRTLVTDYVQVSDEDAIRGARMLAEEEGIFGGFSSGANLAAALQLLEGREQGATIAFLVCDSGLKYVSTDLFGG